MKKTTMMKALLLLLICVMQCKAQSNTDPIFERPSYQFEVEEEAPAGTSIGRVVATDNEQPNDLTYSIVAASEVTSLLSINSSTGLIRTATVINRETSTLSTLNLEVRATDPMRAFVEVRVSIFIIDINDNTPYFENLPATLSLPENFAVGTSVFQAVAIDLDESLNSALLYSITPNDTFTIDQSNGNILIESSLDYDVPSGRLFELLVTVVDRGDMSLSNSSSLTVRVTDINDQDPIFDAILYSVQVHENLTMGTDLITVSAMDQDEGINDAILYSISNGNEEIDGIPSFAIDNTTGMITVNVPSLDRETHSSYQLEIQATESNSITNRAFTMVVITVFDINDHFPSFEMPRYSVNVSELQSVNNSVIILLASDPDGEAHNEFQFTLYNLLSEDELPFSVSSETHNNEGMADITLSQNLDFETQSLYRFMVIATETVENEVRNGTAVVEVWVDNENDNAPSFVENVYDVSVSENRGANARISVLMADDDDFGSFGELVFSLSDEDSGKPFNITTLSGGIAIIKTSRNLNYEERENYTLTVTATDGAEGNQQMTSTAVVLIEIENLNDNPPFFTMNGIPFSDITIDVTEEVPHPLTVLVLEASDLDGTLTDLTFSLVGDTSLGYFVIDQERGLLNTTLPLDFDLRTPNISFFTLEISVNDTVFADILTVQIVVIDINDNSPIFDNSSYTFNVEENTVPGSVLGQVEATDSDSGTFGQVEYTITGPANVTNSFQINRTTGEISIASNIDREQTPGPLLFTVIASDLDMSQENRRSDNASIIVNVLDTNDNTPLFTQPSYVFYIAENTDQINLTVKASDSDIGFNSDIEYSIVNGNEERAFVLDPSSGSITHNESVVLDFEETRLYVLNISAMDAGSPSNIAYVRVNISITDENDITPAFTMGSYNASIREDIPPGSSVIQVEAVDQDTGEFGRLIYSIINVVRPTSPNGSFVIDDETGIISTFERFDRELFAGTYVVNVNVRDNGTIPERNSASVSLTVSILDINDETPVLVQDVNFSPVDEERSPGVLVARVSASDMDQEMSDNSRIDYIITAVSGTPAPGAAVQPSPMDLLQEFSLNVSSTDGSVEVLTNTSLDFEAFTSYEITIRASDNGVPVRSSEIIVPVTVMDINDNTPAFIFPGNDTFYEATLSEDVGFTRVINFMASDQDTGINAQLVFERSSNFPSNFGIQGNQLVLISNSLDFETTQEYSFNVTVRDRGVPSRSSEAQVYIRIEDINDNSPIFNESSYTVEVDEGDYSGVGALLQVTIVATDSDSSALGSISFAIFPENPLFSITTYNNGDDRYEGILSVEGELDRESVDEYTLTLLARDGGVPPNTATATVSVRVNDLNDNDPILSQTGYQVTIEEESGPQVITDFIVSATDLDIGNNSLITFAISNDTFIEIDELTGVLSTTRSFDFESQQSFVLEIYAMDNNRNESLRLADSAMFTVYIADINDNAPFFTSFPSDTEIPENFGIGSPIVNVIAEDIDFGSNAELVFQLSNDQGRFSIDSSGSITLAAGLDRETTDAYNLTVTVFDRGQTSLFVTNFLYIEVTDVNDVPPQFERDIYNFLISEDIEINSILGELLAFDSDEGQNGNITFEIVSGDTSIFSVETMQVDSRQTYSAILINNQEFDYENVTLYSLRIVARNIAPPYHNASADVTITIRDTNDNAPVFSLSEYLISVPEVTPTGSTIGTVVATDVDGGINGTVMYRLPSGSEAGILSTFSVNGQSGVITLLNSLNFEDLERYDFYVEAIDGSDVPLSSNVTVTVFIQDTNEAAPVFDRVTYSAPVREGLPAGTFVIRVNATEGESGGASVRYSIRAGNTQRFTIDDENGIIMTRAALDREEQDRYVLTVQAMDMAALPLSSFAQVLVQVEDINDNTPTFDFTTSETNLLESSPAGTRLSDVFLATDRDIGRNSDIVYTLPSSSPFMVNSSTGVISVRDPAALDREASPVVVLPLSAQDNGTMRRASQINIRVILGDINDNAPTFINAPYTASIPEGSDQGITVIEVVAMDLDIDSNFTFAIMSGDDNENKFTIDDRLGFIETTSTTLDRETRDLYELVISVTDSVAPTRMSTTTVTIIVTDVNEHPPECVENTYFFTTDEDNINQVLLGSVMATDRDQIPIGSGNLIYEFSSPNFTVTSGGNVNAEPGLDFEALVGTETISFEVSVSDTPGDGNIILSGICRVTVTLVDINDNIPVFAEDIYETSVIENTAQGTQVIILEALDSDTGTNGDITYRFLTPTSDFTINSLSGEVTVSGSLDSESNARYELEVGAFDSGVPDFHTGTTRLIISVLDTNDNIPRFDRSFYDVAISENSPFDATVVVVLAEDLDTPELTYSISRGNIAQLFRIDNDSVGIIQVTQSLDREAIPVFNLVITASDGDNDANTTVRISLTDVNDEAPVFTQAEYTAFINENSPEGTAVLASLNRSSIRIQAVDDDAPNTPNSLVVYTLEGTNAPLFNIESSNGRVTVARGTNLDFESSPRIPVTIRATDSDITNPMSSTVMLNVQLVDVNDEPPIFSSQFGYVLVVPEDMAVNRTVTTEISATDRDTVGGRVRYALINANPFSALELFTVNRDSGDLILIQSLDRESFSTITLVVTASDMGEPALSSVVTVQLTVTDVNDNAPQFDQIIFTATVPEYLAQGSSVLRVNAVDPDSAGANSLVVYSLMVGAGDPFIINPVTGTIATTSPLDYETDTSYIFQAVACDQGTPNMMCSSTTIRVNVADFNDEAPQFDQEIYNIDVCLANALSDTRLIQPVATDQDSGNNSVISYSLENAPVLFMVNASSGLVSLATLASEVAEYTLTTVATDNGDSPLSGTAEIIVRIVNCTETNFYFSSPYTYVEITERTDILTDGRGSINIPVVGRASSAGFIPANVETNPFTNNLNILGLKSFADLPDNLREGAGLDHEARNLYTAVLRAVNSEGLMTYTSVTLRVLDDNDNAPEFLSDLLVFTTEENQTAPVEIGSVEAVDRDEGSNGVVTYSVVTIVPPSTPSPFTIDNTTGTISTSRLLDREANTNYEINLQAFDGVNRAVTTVQVVVTDINDCDPTFVEDVYEVSISESVPAGSSVATVRAMDCDEGTNALIQYTIVNGSLGVFELDLTSGVIRTLINLDFEQTSSYSLMVVATDMGSTLTRSGTVNVLFEVVDFNDCPPEFLNPSPFVSIPEGSNLNSILITYTIQDCDSGLNGIDGVMLSIVTGNEEVFAIDSASGSLRIISSLDREQEATYILSIQAMDSAGINSLSSITELTVNVLDVNDETPVFAEDTIFVTINEGEELSQPIITVQASDDDIGSNAQITYLLANGEGKFDIGATTGELILVQTLDREARDSYTLSVIGRDGGAEPRSSNITIIVSVSDENDNDPEIINIISGVTMASVPEGSENGTEVFIVNATDLDLGLNGNIIYSLDGLPGSDNIPFEITGALISVRGRLDYEGQTRYSLVVIAEDMGSPNSRRDIATLIVEVTDRNDNPPMFLQSLYTGSQAENTAIGTDIITVEARDLDEANTNNSAIRYSLDDTQPDAQYFTIDDVTGVLSNNVTIDREARALSFMFSVVATNYLSDRPLTGRAMVMVAIGDINDETPQFNQSLYTAELPERTTLGTLVLVVQATDGDAEAPNSDVTFSLSSGTNIGIPFLIDQISGVIIVQNELDYETRRFYEFNITAQDNGVPMSLSSMATVSINLTDVNDQAPIFSQPQYTAEFVENQPGPFNLVEVEYSDEDTLAEHTASTFRIVTINGASPPASGGLFNITSTGADTAQIVVNDMVDFEIMESFTLEIMITNNENGVGEPCGSLSTCRPSNLATVNIDIVDTNDNSPIFSLPVYNGEVRTLAASGSIVLTVAATDADSSSSFRSIVYGLLNSGGGLFRIDSDSGVVITNGDFENLDGVKFELTVSAQDNNGVAPFNQDIAKVVLFVLNDFQRFAIIFNSTVDAIQRKEATIVSFLTNFTGYEIVVELYNSPQSTPGVTDFIFYAIDNGNIIDFTEFSNRILNREDELFRELRSCNITRITSVANLIVYTYPVLVDTETVVILILCFILIVGAVVLLIVAFRQRYIALHAARHKLLADVFYGSHGGSSIIENIHHENIQLELIENTGQASMNKQNPMFVHPYDNWAGVDTSGVESVGEDSNLQRDNPLYESQEIRMEMFADVTDDEDDMDDEEDEAGLLAAALQDDLDIDDEDNSVTAI